jgi:hypothetical protein
VLHINDTIISLDVIEKKFCCKISTCKGACCVIGDSGAPLETDEVLAIEEALPNIEKLLSEKVKQYIGNVGVAVIDLDGDLVTPLNNNKECVYTLFENGIATCSIEKCWEKGECRIQKPISCHLYPIRLTKYNKFTAVNYHYWDICNPALEFGKQKGMRVFELTKEALIRKFGNEWYKQLCIAAQYVINKERTHD